MRFLGEGQTGDVCRSHKDDRGRPTGVDLKIRDPRFVGEIHRRDENGTEQTRRQVSVKDHMERDRRDGAKPRISRQTVKHGVSYSTVGNRLSSVKRVSLS